MPGGKILIYSGILPITKMMLVYIVGHEVSHALANHGAQRMSAGQLQQVIGAGVSVATSGQSEKHNKYGIKLMVLVHK
jgi:Zn-dependent protease with chaperone function